MPRSEPYRNTKSGKAPSSRIGRTLDRIWRGRAFALFALARAHRAQAVGAACVAMVAFVVTDGANATTIGAVALAGSLLAAVTFALEVPALAPRAHARAATLEKAADRLLADKPRRGLALYDSVLALTADASLIRRVSGKRRLLSEQLEADPAPPPPRRPGRRAQGARKVRAATRQGPSFKGCSPSISAHSTAKRRVFGLICR